MGEAKGRAAHSKEGRQIYGVECKADYDGAMTEVAESPSPAGGGGGDQEGLNGGGSI